MTESIRPYSVDEIRQITKEYKKTLKFFDDPVFDTHFEWEENLYESVKNRINDTIEYICNFDLDFDTFNSLQLKAEYIVDYYSYFPEVVLLGLQGKRAKAYHLIKQKIWQKLELVGMFSFKSLPGHPVFGENESEVAYRIREGENSYNSNYYRKDLFHIPFELNHLVANNRFSLSGFPCLYMANSVYGCWEELDRPDLNNCFVSKFDLSNLCFLDLSVNKHEASKRLKSHCEYLDNATTSLPASYVEAFVDYLSDYLYIWPAIFCCSLKVKHQSSVYKPEYIFPQLILEYLVSADVIPYDGIKFLSIKPLSFEGHLNGDVSLFAKNYVVPARKYSPRGFCEEYVRKISLTEPINYAFQVLLGRCNTNNVTANSEYGSTIFGKIEEILSNYELSYINQ